MPGAPDGGIPLSSLPDRIRDIGYDGAISLELFDAGFEAQWAAYPVAASRKAYERCTALVPDRWSSDAPA